ncbi:aromatase/cyclase [Pseudofrankia inefficax]|uniref:Polyketide cyclase/dehydrase n=1 Tax=Pseudofrankia inefficax (strain DSM 45817 / CECT 9037 / DDB 130130 / EuI1c) TaxID=298654 RepID=E3J3Q0_PSEI1|nr:SRPBCC family protein [Pseudofrankia inefficax]ADP79387.1 Polyketide cyclase/dehydrase [Pseudofrankia inefficax]
MTGQEPVERPAGGARHERVHTMTVAAPAEGVYDLVADVTRWPAVFGPTVHVEHRWRDAGAERFQLWATANGEVKTWTSRRTLDPVAGRITFEQERSQAPIASMGGEWSFSPDGPHSTLITLRHHFTAVGDDPAAVEWIGVALDRNSEAELASLRRIAELGHPPSDLVFAFEDVERTPGRAADAYEYIRRGDLWADRLPHVRSARMTEDADGVQELTMETETADGSTHRTSSTRLLLGGSRIVYTQHVLPALLLGHSGQWIFEEDVTPGPDGGALATTVTARHLVAVDPAAVPTVLGTGTTLAEARAFVRDALGANSRVTLRSACAYAADRAAVAGARAGQR